MINNEIRESLKRTCGYLNKHNVEYMIIGGIAVGFYGYQRISGGYNPEFPEIKNDLDFWYNPTITNYYALVNAIKEMGVNTVSLEEVVFDPQKTYLRIPHKSFKTEFLPQMKGLKSFSISIKNAREISLDGNRLYIIGYSDLIKNKETVNRAVDRRDIHELKSINREKKQ